MKLSELGSGESAYIVKVAGNGGFRKRIIEMGFVRGQKVTSLQSSPLNDPIKYSVMGYDISLRRSEAEMIDVITSDNKGQEFESRCQRVFVSDCNTCSGDSCALGGCCSKIKAPTKNNVINIALIGNPNSGKTSLFNILSGSKERVGNYSGVTVDAKLGHFDYKGYRFNITDLPGTYSLSAYSPEEIYVRQHLLSNSPDIIINAVVASNLERNLYLTTEIIDLNIPTVVALNMYDELEKSGAQLDIPLMENIMGLPLVPTVAKTGEGLGKLLDTVIEMFEGQNKVFRHIHINYGNAIE
ncbi:MAG: 50S ribosome-binding GTPase [Bacteroidales bacterium]|nr:50S ribosome-binding GTPase [Bacteroidales bacterium]